MEVREESTKATFDFQPEKFQELVLYIAEQSQDDPRFGAVKLMKLLFYSDFGAYRLFGEPITGATYQHYPQGPVPKEWKDTKRILIEAEDATEEVREYFMGNQKRLIPQRGANIALFDPVELKLVGEVIQEFENYNATSISEFSHREWAWRSTNDREDIPYNTAWVSRGPLSAEQIEVGLGIAEREGLIV